MARSKRDKNGNVIKQWRVSEIRGPSAEKLAERRPGQFNEELPCIWFDYAGDGKDPKRELDERAWKGVLSWRFFIEQGWFLSVFEKTWQQLCAQFRIPKENAAAYGPYRYNPARLSHFALPHDDFDALWEARLEKGLLSEETQELYDGDTFEWLNSEGVELTCEEAAPLFEAYTDAYFSMMFREFEGWEHVARKSFPLMADVAEVRKFYAEQSAHGDVPVPKLIDKNEFGNNRALLRTMVQQKTGKKPAKNLTRDSLVRRIVTRDREDELDAYGKEFARVMHFISNDIKKADDELKKAVKVAVKKFIVDEWNGERKKDYLRKLARKRAVK